MLLVAVNRHFQRAKKCSAISKRIDPTELWKWISMLQKDRAVCGEGKNVNVCRLVNSLSTELITRYSYFLIRHFARCTFYAITLRRIAGTHREVPNGDIKICRLYSYGKAEVPNGLMEVSRTTHCYNCSPMLHPWFRRPFIMQGQWRFFHLPRPLITQLDIQRFLKGHVNKVAVIDVGIVNNWCWEQL